MTPIDDEVIRQFSDRVNAVLSQDASGVEPISAVLQQAPAGIPANRELLDALQHAFQRANEPDRFFNIRMYEPGDRFDQCYELLRTSFDEAERDPLDRFLYMLRMLQNPDNDHPLVMIGRFWRVSGSQAYDAAGRLQHFTFDPMTVTDSIMALVSGNYMSLRPVQAGAAGIGAMGHLATRKRFRRGRGHGSALVRVFESEMEGIAKSRGETLLLIALEAEEDSEGFWYKQGYRWAVGTRYAQPPLEFDPTTGERLHDEVPETLMIKIPGQPAATTVGVRVLEDAVRTMYQNWCLEKARAYESAAARRAEEYVMGKVFRDFVASLPQDGDVPLGPPPSL